MPLHKCIQNCIDHENRVERPDRSAVLCTRAGPQKQVRDNYAKLAGAFNFKDGIKLYLIHRKTVKSGYSFSQGRP